MKYQNQAPRITTIAVDLDKLSQHASGLGLASLGDKLWDMSDKLARAAVIIGDMEARVAVLDAE